MILKFSADPTPRPPETTRLALCRSGRSDSALARSLNRVWVGSSVCTSAASIAALPPLPASDHEAVRTVATTVLPAGASTVVNALRALLGRLKVWLASTSSASATLGTPSRAATHGNRSFPQVVDGRNEGEEAPATFV